jgi:hypothetical protein
VCRQLELTVHCASDPPPLSPVSRRHHSLQLQSGSTLNQRHSSDVTRRKKPAHSAIRAQPTQDLVVCELCCTHACVSISLGSTALHGLLPYCVYVVSVVCHFNMYLYCNCSVSFTLYLYTSCASSPPPHCKRCCDTICWRPTVVTPAGHQVRHRNRGTATAESSNLQLQENFQRS